MLAGARWCTGVILAMVAVGVARADTHIVHAGGEDFLCTTNIAGTECTTTTRTLAQQAILRAGGTEKEQFCVGSPFSASYHGEECEEGYNAYLVGIGVLKKGQSFYANSSFERREDERTIRACNDPTPGAVLPRLGYCLRVKFRVVERVASEQIDAAKEAAAVCPAEAKKAIRLRRAWVAAELRYFKAKAAAAESDSATVRERLQRADATLTAASESADQAAGALGNCVEGK